MKYKDEVVLFEARYYTTKSKNKTPILVRILKRKRNFLGITYYSYRVATTLAALNTVHKLTIKFYTDLIIKAERVKGEGKELGEEIRAYVSNFE